MPDDTESAEQETVEEVVETNEVAENSDGGPMTDEQIEALFSSIDEPVKKEPKAKKEPKSKVEETAEADEDEEETEEDEDSEEESDEEEETEEDDDDEVEVSAADKLKELAAQAKEQKAEAAAKVAQQEAATEAEQKIRKSVMDELSGATEIQYGDQTINLEEFREEYPDLAQTIEALSLQAATAMHKQSLEAGGYVSKEEVEALKMEIANERFISELHMRHPNLDVRNLPTNDDFWAWKEKQDADTQAFFEDQTVHGMSAVLAAYEESLVKAKNKAVDEVAKEKKAKHVSLHSSSARTKKPAARKAAERDDGGTLDAKGQAKLFKDIKIED